MDDFVDALQFLGVVGGILFLACTLAILYGGIRVKFTNKNPVFAAGTVDDSLVRLREGELVAIDDDLLEALGGLYAESGLGTGKNTFYRYLTQVADMRKKTPLWKAGYKA